MRTHNGRPVATLDPNDGQPTYSLRPGARERAAKARADAPRSIGQTIADVKKKRYHELWAEIHARPLRYVGDHEAEMEWLRGLSARLPRDCGCDDDWQDQLTAHPPDLSSPLAYARWGHETHERFSVRLGKPAMPWDAAVALHGWGVLAG